MVSGALYTTLRGDMTRTSKFKRGLRMIAAFSFLAAILACGGGDDDGDDDSTGSGSRTFMLRPGFTPDPATATGTAGGSFQASTRGSGCTGHIGAVSNHTLHLTAAFTNLRVIVNSAQDTTLVIQLANGEYRCNDDSEGFNPIVEGAFPAGIHRIYVGSYSQGQTPAYTIGITELSNVTSASVGGGAAAPTAPPTPTPPPGATTAVSLTTGFMPDPQTRTGVAGGTLNAMQLTSNGPGCRGHLPATPQHTMMLTGSFQNLRVMVNGGALDTTLVIMGPDGAYRCNDDGGGNMQPLVEGAFGPGAYQVWVGSYSSTNTGPYTIGFTELSSVTPASLN